MTLTKEYYLDAMRYVMQASRVQHRPEPPAIKAHSDGEMIHEMLERGYAVMKIPSDGKLKVGGE